MVGCLNRCFRSDVVLLVSTSSAVARNFSAIYTLGHLYFNKVFTLFFNYIFGISKVDSECLLISVFKS